MKTFGKYILTAGLVLSSLFSLKAQNLVSAGAENGIICRVEADRLIFDIDLNQSAASLKEYAVRFDIDTALLRQALQGVPAIVMTDALWTAQRIGSSRLLLSKSLLEVPPATQPADVVMIDQNWVTNLVQSFSQPVVAFGINRFTDDGAFSYRDGLATFFLRGRKNAKKVMLSGTFNNWSTMLTRMEKTEEGWSITLPLKPGEYEYKYIVDGVWTIDPANDYKRDNDAGSENSVVYVYNHRFFLPGYTLARRVVLAASFNGWNSRGPRLVKVENGWELPLWVKEGTHAYKFIVDGEWIADPGARVNRPDGSGNYNSFVGIGDTMFFRLRGLTKAKGVVVAGNFNGWSRHELQMTPTQHGWELPYVLAPGMYEYKFIVDGQWITDPDNPFTNGTGEGPNAILVVDPNYVFRLKGHAEAREVSVSGSFNGWSEPGYMMTFKDGAWVFPACLNTGKHSYKFLVDGKWMLDPENKLWEENQYNTGNSVLWIEQ